MFTSVFAFAVTFIITAATGIIYIQNMSKLNAIQEDTQRLTGVIQDIEKTQSKTTMNVSNQGMTNFHIIEDEAKKTSRLITDYEHRQTHYNNRLTQKLSDVKKDGRNFQEKLHDRVGELQSTTKEKLENYYLFSKKDLDDRMNGHKSLSAFLNTGGYKNKNGLNEYYAKDFYATEIGTSLGNEFADYKTLLSNFNSDIVMDVSRNAALHTELTALHNSNYNQVDNNMNMLKDSWGNISGIAESIKDTFDSDIRNKIRAFDESMVGKLSDTDTQLSRYVAHTFCDVPNVSTQSNLLSGCLPETKVGNLLSHINNSSNTYIAAQRTEIDTILNQTITDISGIKRILEPESVATDSIFYENTQLNVQAILNMNEALAAASNDIETINATLTSNIGSLSNLAVDLSSNMVRKSNMFNLYSNHLLNVPMVGIPGNPYHSPFIENKIIPSMSNINVNADNICDSNVCMTDLAVNMLNYNNNYNNLYKHKYLSKNGVDMIQPSQKINFFGSDTERSSQTYAQPYSISASNASLNIGAALNITTPQNGLYINDVLFDVESQSMQISDLHSKLQNNHFLLASNYTKELNQLSDLDHTHSNYALKSSKSNVEAAYNQWKQKGEFKLSSPVNGYMYNSNDMSKFAFQKQKLFASKSRPSSNAIINWPTEATKTNEFDQIFRKGTCDISQSIDHTKIMWNPNTVLSGSNINFLNPGGLAVSTIDMRGIGANDFVISNNGRTSNVSPLQVKWSSASNVFVNQVPYSNVEFAKPLVRETTITSGMTSSIQARNVNINDSAMLAPATPYAYVSFSNSNFASCSNVQVVWVNESKPGGESKPTQTYLKGNGVSSFQGQCAKIFE